MARRTFFRIAGVGLDTLPEKGLYEAFFDDASKTALRSISAKALFPTAIPTGYL